MRFAWPPLLFCLWTAAVALPLQLIVSFFDNCYRFLISIQTCSMGFITGV